MANTLSISVTADVADLQAKFAVAQATVRSLNSEMTALARQSAKGILDPAGAAQLQLVSGKLLEARAQAEGFAGEAARAGVTLQGVSRAAGESSVHVGSAAREFRALSSDLARGDYARLPIVFGMLARSLAGVGAAGMLAVVGVGAVAAGLAYLAIRALGASHALDEMQIAAAAAGNLDLTRSKLKGFADELGLAGNVSQAEAQKIVLAFAHIPGMAAPSLDAAQALVSRFASASGLEAEKAGDALVKLFKAPTAGDAIKQLEALGFAVDLDAKNMAAAADASNNANQRTAEIINLVTAATGRSESASIKEAASFQASWANKLQLGAAWIGETALVVTGLDQIASRLGIQNPVVAAQNALIEKQTALWQKNNETLAARPKQIATTEQTQEQKIEVGIQYVEKGKPLTAQIRETRTELDGLGTAVSAAQARLNELTAKNLNPELIKQAAANVADMNSRLQEQRQHLDDLQYGPVMARARTEMEQTASTSNATQTEILEKQKSVIDEYLAKVRTGSAQYVELQGEAARMDLEIKRSESSDVIAEMHRLNEEIQGDTSKSAIARLAIERQNLQELLSNEKVIGQAKIEIAQDVASKDTEISRTAVSEQEAIERSDADSVERIGHMKIEAEKSSLDTEVELHQISASQKLTILKTLTQQEAAEDIKQLEAREATLQQEPDKAREVANQILEIREKLNVDLAALDREHAADAARAAAQEVTAWKQAVGEIETAETSMLQDLLTKKKSFGASAYAAAGRLADQEIESDVRAITTRMLFEDNADAQKKALEQGGIGYHMYAEQAKTGATAEGTGQRTGLATGEASKDATTEQTVPQSRVVAEAQKTAAAQTGSATRTGVVSGEVSQQAGIEQTVPLSRVAAEAQKTAATTTGSTTRTGLVTTEVSQQSTVEQTASLSHAIAEAQKTAATTSGATQRTGLTTAEVAHGTTLDQTSATTHTITETEKTAATHTGTTTRALSENTEQIQSRTVEQTGVVVHSTAETEKTGATHVGVAQRTAAENSSNSNIFVQIGQMVGRWFGMESSKTAATTAGATTRTTVQETSDTTAGAAALLAGETQIAINAAVGATAAGASVAVIPIYGWAMATPTAAATYAELMAYSASLDTGAWDIPQDMTARVHAGESVMPRDFASGFRAAAAGEGGGGGDSYGDTHVTNHFHQVMPTSEKIIGQLRKAVRNAHPATLR